MNRFARRDANRVADQVEARAKQLAGILVNVRTGRYRAAFHKRETLTFRGPGARVYNDVSYAPYIEEGTRPHVIRARRGKALRFVVDGRVVYAKEVHHPGTKAYNVLSRAVREVAIRNGYNVRING
jgi:hypothetical protein